MAAAALASETVARRAFFAAAREQGKCQVTGDTGWFWHPHHVIRWQDLRALGLPRYDPRNVLRLSEHAHVDHHQLTRRVRTIELRLCNVEYAVEILGAVKATAYLRRRYDDTTAPDPRLEALCPAI